MEGFIKAINTPTAELNTYKYLPNILHCALQTTILYVVPQTPILKVIHLRVTSFELCISSLPITV